MKSITLLSPKVVTFPEESIQVKISHQMYTDEKLGVKLPVNYSLFMVLTEKGADGKFIMPLDGTAIFGKETVQMLNSVKNVIGQCSQTGEILFGRLKIINTKFKNVPELKDVFAAYEEKYHKLDFMGHRDLLSAIFKSKKLDWLNEILKNYDVKAATKAFNNFILDRNKYTHGELMYWYPSKETLLEYETEARVTEHGLVNSDTLNSYLTCYKDLDDLLSKIDEKLK